MPHWVVQVAIVGSLAVWITYAAVRAWRQADEPDRLPRVRQTYFDVRAAFLVYLLVVGAIIALLTGK